MIILATTLALSSGFAADAMAHGGGGGGGGGGFSGGGGGGHFGGGGFGGGGGFSGGGGFGGGGHFGGGGMGHLGGGLGHPSVGFSSGASSGLSGVGGRVDPAAHQGPTTYLGDHHRGRIHARFDRGYPGWIDDCDYDNYRMNPNPLDNWCEY